jgi:hypothetical protein
VLPSDIDAAARTAAARQLLDQLGEKGFVDLTVLAGADLCVLGGPKHPLFWEPLARAWLEKSPQDLERLTQARTASMVERGLLIPDLTAPDPTAPGSVHSLDPRLGIALVARTRPAFAITVHFTPAIPPLSLFALGDEEVPVRGIVVESPGGNPAAPDEPPKGGPLGVVFYYLLVTPGNAADFLAKWTIRPTPAKRPFRGQPPRIVSLFRPASEPGSVGWHLAVHGDGTRARVDSPDGSAADLAGEYDAAGLRDIGLELIARGTS